MSFRYVKSFEEFCTANDERLAMMAAKFATHYIDASKILQGFRSQAVLQMWGKFEYKGPSSLIKWVSDHMRCIVIGAEFDRFVAESHPRLRRAACFAAGKYKKDEDPDSLLSIFYSRMKESILRGEDTWKTIHEHQGINWRLINGRFTFICRELCRKRGGRDDEVNLPHEFDQQSTEDFIDSPEFREMLVELSPLEWKILSFRVDEALTHATIGSLLHMTEKAVKVTYEGALQKLRRCRNHEDV